MSQEIFKADFNKIASLPDSHAKNNLYERFLLAQIPARCDKALEVGCGAGAFSRLLAARSQNVLAIDFSSGMIGLARVRSSEQSNIEFLMADISEIDLVPESFDCIVSIATLHHLSQEATLEKLKRALKPNGILLIHDLFESEGLVDPAINMLALAVNAGRQLLYFGRLRPPPKVREAWREHGRHDTYLTLAQIRRLRDYLLPQAVLKRHLLWRYSLIWRKPYNFQKKPAPPGQAPDQTFTR